MSMAINFADKFHLTKILVTSFFVAFIMNNTFPLVDICGGWAVSVPFYFLESVMADHLNQ